jgi:WD40 repeat protein
MHGPTFKGIDVATLRLLAPGTVPGGLSGELLCCAYTPDGAFAVSGGWDGHLRLWETTNGAHLTDFRISDKPVSACTISPDGKNIVAGTLEGLLSVWDVVSHQQKVGFLAHTRPISCVTYAADGKTIATASWDNSITVWVSLRSHDARPLNGHRDIVAGCRFTPDGQNLLSWSHDAAVYLWNLSSGQPQQELAGHADRILAGAVSPDGQWAATGSRDGVLKLWNLSGGAEAASATLRGEIRGCEFLMDGRTLVVVDKDGRLTLHDLPDLQQQSEVITPLAIQCCDLAPSGNQIALACGNGRVRFVAVDGFDSAPLLVGMTRTTRRVASPLQKLLGRSHITYVYQAVCPACRHPFELSEVKAGQTMACPGCKRQLQFSGVMRIAMEK